MNTIILFWNPEISSYTIERLREDLENYTHVSNWSVWEHENAHKGDRFFMVRCGKGKTGICMSGRFCSEPYLSEDWSGKGREVYYMDLDADTVIEPDTLPILFAERLSQEIPSFDWSGGHSGRLLPESDAEKLEKLWADFLENNKHIFDRLALHTYISDFIEPSEDNFEPYIADIKITYEGDFKIQDSECSVEVCGEDWMSLKKEFAKKMKEAGKIIPIEFEFWGVFNTWLFQKALDIAKEAYKGLNDEFGEPYFKRALRETSHFYCDSDMLVSLLQYVLRNPKFTTKTLIQNEIPESVVKVIDILQQKKKENFEQYLKRVGKNPAATHILCDIVSKRLEIKNIPELTLDKFTSLAQDLRAYHYLQEKQYKSNCAIFSGHVKDFEMWLSLYSSATIWAIRGEYDDNEVAEMARVLSHCTGGFVDISEFNVGRWANDEPNKPKYEDLILGKISEDEEKINILEKMILNRKYGTLFEFRNHRIYCDNGRVLVHVPIDCYVEIEPGVEVIGKCAVAKNINITELIYPKGLTAIDDYAFAYCEHLERVRLTDSVTQIGVESFACCEISDLVLSNSLTTISEHAFAYNSIEHLEIPSSVKRIESCAFFGNLIEKQVIPEGVETIGCSTFTELKHITLPSTLKEIAYDFYYEEMIDDPEDMKPYVDIHSDNPVYYSEGGTLYRRDTGKEALGKAGREQSEQ